MAEPGAVSPIPFPPGGRLEAPPGLAVTDEVRERAVGWLRHAAGQGTLTLDEFGERALAVYAAPDLPAVWSALSGLDLPSPVANALPAHVRTVDPTGNGGTSQAWHVAVFSGHERKGRWRMRARSVAAAVFGSVKLDVRDATIAEATEELELTALALFGSVEVTVPEGMEVDASGFAAFGAKEVRLAEVPVRAGLPVLRVKAFAAFGSVHVRSRPSRDKEKERRAAEKAARRAARAEARRARRA